MFAIRHDVYHHNNDEKLDRIIALLGEVLRKEDLMSKELDDLTLQVKANTDLEASAIALIQGIAAQLLAAKDDPIKVAALSSSLKSSATALADAITANTAAA